MPINQYNLDEIPANPFEQTPQSIFQPAQQPVQPPVQPPVQAPVQSAFQPPVKQQESVVESIPQPSVLQAAQQVQQAEQTGLQSQQEAIKAKVQTEQLITEAEKNNALTNALQSENMAVSELDRLKKQNEAYNANIAKIDANINELSQFKFQNFFESRGTGTKILAAFAIGLGAIGSGLTKGPNTALGIIQKAIDDDSARQVQQFNANKAVIGEMRNSLETARQLGMDAGTQQQYLNGLKTITVTDQLKSKLATIKASNPAVAKELEANLDRMNTESKQKILDIEAKVRAPKQVTATYSRVNPAEMDEATSKMYKDYNAHPLVQRGMHLKASADMAFSSLPTGVGDVNMIYAFAKSMDPSGAVQAGDMNTIKESQSIPENIKQDLVKSLNNNGTWNPEMRTKFLNQIAKTITDYEAKTLNPINRQFEVRASRTGVNPEDFLAPRFEDTRKQGKVKLSPQEQATLNWAKKNPNDPDAKAFLNLYGGK